MTRVKEQGAAGTCWAFAAVGQVEAVINITTNIPNFNFDLAEQTLVSDCCLYYGACDGGMHFWALNYMWLIRGQNNLCGWYTYDVEYQPGD